MNDEASEESEAEVAEPTVPQLRIFHIFVYYKSPQREPDRVLRSFKCPNLTDFKFNIPLWTPETYKIIENHYNLHQLLRFETSGYPYPVSKLLFDAPMLQGLVLIEKIFMDKKALQGIASGERGRCLASLGFQGNFDKKTVLNMVASRQRHVKKAVEVSRSWQDQISSIKWIALLDNKRIDCTQLENELKGLGVVVYDSTRPMNSWHPLSSLGD